MLDQAYFIVVQTWHRRILETEVTLMFEYYVLAGALAMRWSFPKPTGDGLVVISYPFILKSAN